jgi:hypothetical protein
MVAIERKLKMNHLQFHLISEAGKKMEGSGIYKSDGVTES